MVLPLLESHILSSKVAIDYIQMYIGVEVMWSQTIAGEVCMAHNIYEREFCSCGYSYYHHHQTSPEHHAICRHILDPLSSERFRVLRQCPAQSVNAEHWSWNRNMQKNKSAFT